ncbi:uncharacterized protein E0L32_005105 [Thyridium curvatum]|uniref:DUF7053 domain-containing protein n=1 Tax=Thyridium curvatum TaxID=1093900 RepID=A0A507BDW9_9PEZI|nr:uncharacterized protein E0L32_005105 [Thyridium curvatum]TPX14710.1 hypothetical protein E0L32_005105 [Thyridium curvatum]
MKSALGNLAKVDPTVRMLRKKETFTIVTPIPGFIPRQLAIDILHSHSEVITLNPLVLEHKPVKAPRDAQADEFYSTWYEIVERIQYVPGLGRMGSGKISFNGCFHDMPWGLQTHIYAPMNVDLRNTYRIAGNQPGVEPPETPEIGLGKLGVPADGLYLREDIEIKCNVAVLSFVKAQLKAAGQEMVQRIIKKAELLDAGVLQAMIEDGKLKTINPADRSNTSAGASAVRSPQPSPTTIPAHFQQGGGGGGGGGGPNPPLSPQVPYQIPRPGGFQRPQSHMSQHGGYIGVSQSSYGGFPSPGQQQYHHQQQQTQASAAQELSATSSSSVAHQGAGGGGGGQQQVIMELPGDYYHPQQGSPGLQPPPPSQHSPGLPSSDRDSATLGSSGRWSATDYQSQGGSRPTSVSSDHSGAGAGGGFKSPGLDKGFASELATHNETSEEHRGDTLRKLDGRQQQQQQHQQQNYSYNPADYAKVPYGQNQPRGSHPQQMGYGYGHGHGHHQQQQQQYGH